LNGGGAVRAARRIALSRLSRLFRLFARARSGAGPCASATVF